MKMAIQKGAYTCGSASARSQPRECALTGPRVRTRDLESTQSQNNKYIAMQI